MSQYVENNLRSDEQIIMKAKVNILYIIKFIIWSVILLVGGILLYVFVFADGDDDFKKIGLIVMFVMIALAIIIILVGLMHLYSVALATTNKRVVGKIGILQRKTLDYPIEKVDNVTVHATLLGRLFHFSTVEVTGSNDKDALHFIGIKNANEFKNSLIDAIEKAKEEARRAQAEEIARAMQGANNNNAGNN